MQGSLCAIDEGKLLISAAEMGRLLGVNKSTVWSWHSSGRIPQPVKIGGTTRWRTEEIRQWIDEGCPARARWEQVRRKE
jgi:predicted DNA-binding transcriptional regulator AlpA